MNKNYKNLQTRKIKFLSKVFINSRTKDPDESWQNHRIKINKNNNLRKESYEVELIGTNINNRDRIKFNEKS